MTVHQIENDDKEGQCHDKSNGGRSGRSAWYESIKW